MKLIDYIISRIPDHALSYLVNGDASGIETEDEKNADAWLQDCTSRLESLHPGCHVLFTFREGDEGSFTHYPAFGLACNCVGGALLALVPDDHPAPGIARPWDEDEKGDSEL